MQCCIQNKCNVMHCSAMRYSMCSALQNKSALLPNIKMADGRNSHYFILSTFPCTFYYMIWKSHLQCACYDILHDFRDIISFTFRTLPAVPPSLPYFQLIINCIEGIESIKGREFSAKYKANVWNWNLCKPKSCFFCSYTFFWDSCNYCTLYNFTYLDV